MKQKIVNLYEFAELSDMAKQKAIDNWYKDENYPLLDLDLTEYCKALLEEAGIAYENLKLYYSLSYSQGDGLCFVGDFVKGQIKMTITHQGRYYYANSVDFDFTNYEYLPQARKSQVPIAIELKATYFDICKILEKEGYDIIEYRMTFDEMQELCEANGYIFLENGKMENK